MLADRPAPSKVTVGQGDAIPFKPAFVSTDPLGAPPLPKLNVDRPVRVNHAHVRQKV
jgi:hypothetical protein